MKELNPKKATFPDSLSVNLIQSLSDVVIGPLCDITNTSKIKFIPHQLEGDKGISPF